MHPKRQCEGSRSEINPSFNYKVTHESPFMMSLGIKVQSKGHLNI